MFKRFCMNPIRSAPTIWYNSAPHQQVVQNESGTIRTILCFRDPIRNAPKLCFDNRIASTQMKLIDCLANRQINNKYGRRNKIILARNGVTGLLSRLHVTTHTPERFLYWIQESDPA